MAILAALGLKAVGLRRHSVAATVTSRLLSKAPGYKRGISLFLFASLGLLLLGQYENPAILGVQSVVLEATAPLVDLVSRPFSALSSVSNYIQSQQNLREEIESLKAQNSVLLQSNQAMQVKVSENERLRQLLHTVEDKKLTAITTRVIGVPANALSESIIINAASKDGLKKNAVVLNHQGVVGRVVHVGKKTSRVMPSTDVSSRIPIQVEGNNDHAILAGNGSDLKLVHHENSSNFKKGDRLVTSGYGGIFPPGLPVAVITSISGEIVKATPLVRLQDLDFAVVLRD